MICIGTLKNFQENLTCEEEILKSKNLPSNLTVIDFYDDSKKLAKNNFKNNGEQTYVISPIDSSDKISGDYRNCTGILVVGRDKNSGEEISFLSHNDSNHFLKNNLNLKSFKKDLDERLTEMKERAEKGSVDAIIIGGNYLYNIENSRKRYIKSIKVLSEEFSEIFGFEAIVSTGPKMEAFGEEIIL